MKNVLIVDDDRDDRLLLRHMLRHCDLDVSLQEAPNAEIAAELYKNTDFDCIILDYNLEEKTGDVVLQDIVSSECDTQVITLTSMGDAAIADKMLAGGAADFLLKDELTPQVLERTLKFSFSRRAYQLRLRAYEENMQTLVKELSTANHRLTQQQQALQNRAGALAREVARRQQTEQLLQEQQQHLAELIEVRTQQFRHAQEYAQESSKQAELASRIKTQFLAAMSHELRTPLNGVIGMIDLLSSTPLSQEQRDYVVVIQQSAQALLGIIGNILDISKIEADSIELQNQVFDVVELLNSIQKLEKAAAVRRSLRLRFTLDPRMPRWLIGDANRLRQILINLIDNALKYTPSGSVDVECQLLEQTTDRCKLSFRVRDTGPGISKDKQALMFQPFQQLQDGGVHSGVGLGLAIVTRLAKLMDAEVTVDSTLGKGSTFSLIIGFAKTRLKMAETLPTAPSAENFPRHNTLRPSVRLSSIPIDWKLPRPLRVLVVEDNSVNRAVALGMLKKLGCEVDEASDGEAALLLLTRNQYDLMLMDVNMPGIDGLETTRRWRTWERENQRSPMTIIALTANALEGDKQRCLSAGMNDYLTKPFLISDVATVLKRCVSASVDKSPPSA